MCEIIFTYKGLDTLIQCQNEEKVKEVINRYIQKIGIDINSIYSIYGGSIVNNELTINELIKPSDKNENKMNLLVYNIEEEKENLQSTNEGLVKSKIIICPKCYENCLIKIKDYKISLYGCKNNDITENILLEEFEKTQNINNLKIICNNSSCNTNRNSTYKNKFYKCLTCNINLCPLCNSNHDKNHIIIDYEQKNYKCKVHNDSFISYCEECKLNLCFLCKNDHNKTHKIIDYRKIIQKNNKIKEEMKTFKKKIDEFNNSINEIINMLKKVIFNIQVYYEINYNIINNFEIQNKNYELLRNISEIENNFKMNDINDIINEKNINEKFRKINEIYNKIIIKKNLNEENINDIKDNNNEKVLFKNIDPFNLEENITIKDLKFYNITEQGNIVESLTYKKEFKEIFYFNNKINISFCFKYSDTWYPLITAKEKFISNFREIYFENWHDIKKQTIHNFEKWIHKIKSIGNSYNEINKLNEFKFYYKTDSFYQACEKIIRHNIILMVKIFKKKLDNYNRIIKINDISFEFIAYHIFNTYNFLYNFHKCLTKKIQNILSCDYHYYINSNKNDDKDLALYNYIIKLYSIFEGLKKEFIESGWKLKLNAFDIQTN